jgi:hypothetical protein
MLKKEDVIVKEGKIENFKELFFDDFSVERTKNETLP